MERRTARDVGMIQVGRPLNMLVVIAAVTMVTAGIASSQVRASEGAATASRSMPATQPGTRPVSRPAAGISPAEYLRRQLKPTFRLGHTLPPLTRFGWTLPLDARVELAEHWGYALEFGGYATTKLLDKELDDANSISSKVLALAASDPNRYRLAVIVARDLPKDVPPETWTRDANGQLVEGKQIWSPEAPDSVFEEAGKLRADPLRRIRRKCPIAVVLNGGEYALGVCGFEQKAWSQDPRIVKAKGDQPWFDYVSQRKARQELIITKAVREAAPDRLLYIYYPCGGGIHRNRYGGWDQWGWGYQWMQNVSDLPSNELYYRSFNDGWTGNTELATMALNAVGLEISLGRPLSYNWLCAGWTREKLGESAFSDIPRYMGFLKCCYTAGMIGGNAGYYAYPQGGFAVAFEPNAPPHWLEQMIAFARVHALFSHLEGFLREGDLLPGPDKHRWSKDMPAYEFPTGQAGDRVVARKMRKPPEWLITSWAADGIDRQVKVTIPELGEVSLQARACGSVYRATLEKDKPVLRLIDEDGLLPTKGPGR